MKERFAQYLFDVFLMGLNEDWAECLPGNLIAVGDVQTDPVFRKRCQPFKRRAVLRDQVDTNVASNTERGGVWA